MKAFIIYNNHLYIIYLYCVCVCLCVKITVTTNMINELSYEVGAWEHCEVRCLIFRYNSTRIAGVVSWCLVCSKCLKDGIYWRLESIRLNSLKNLDIKVQFKSIRYKFIKLLIHSNHSLGKNLRLGTCGWVPDISWSLKWDGFVQCRVERGLASESLTFSTALKLAKQ